MSGRKAGRISLFDRWLATMPAGDAARLASVPVILADNVADYYVSRSQPWSLEDRGDFPNVAPPFPRMWIEWTMRSQMSHESLREGVLLTAREPADALATHGRTGRFAFLPETRWVLETQPILSYRNGIVPAFDMGLLAIGSDGQILPHTLDGQRSALSTKRTIDVDEDTFNAILGGATFPALLAISFMHCKNISIAAVEPEDTLSRAWKRRHGRPLVRHHVLNIDPMKRVLRTEGRSEEVGLAQALHICRGHFKTYTPEHPLFGRTTGTFWWPMTVRGNPAAGIVTKDYSIGAPAMGA